VEQNFGPLGTNLAIGSEISRNAGTLHFAKEFTTVTYGIGIGRARCLWKAYMKCHSVSSKKNNLRII
jgi:hypothetical protein